MRSTCASCCKIKFCYAHTTLLGDLVAIGDSSKKKGMEHPQHVFNYLKLSIFLQLNLVWRQICIKAIFNYMKRVWNMCRYFVLNWSYHQFIWRSIQWNIFIKIHPLDAKIYSDETYIHGCVEGFTLFQSYHDLEKKGFTISEIVAERPGIEPRTCWSASQELKTYTTASPSYKLIQLTTFVYIYKCIKAILHVWIYKALYD